MVSPGTLRTLKRKWRAVGSKLSERGRRLWAASEARALGHGGIAALVAATGLGRRTVWAGCQELDAGEAVDSLDGRVRRAGAGRPRATVQDPGLLPALKALVSPVTRGDPMRPLLHTCKSVRNLAAELREQQHPVSPNKVAALLRDAGYSVQGNRKTEEGKQHPDRDAQFRYLNDRCARMLRRGQPVISVDTKKKELLGPFKNGGREWRPKGKPHKVRTHDFPDEKLGKAIPYGVYDIARDEGFVNVGISKDTAEFAVTGIRRWWLKLGRQRYANATELLITADAGGSNAARNRLWKASLQAFSNQTGLTLHVLHFPPGTSKWNKIEHRLFCHITRNWRGRPLANLDVVVALIGHTTTRSGLKVYAVPDYHAYECGKKVDAATMDALNITPHAFHGEWNYTIRPQK